MKHALSFLIAFFASMLLLTSCSNKIEDGLTTYLNTELQAGSVNISDLFYTNGYTILETSPESELRSLHKVLFVDDKVIVVDNETDFHNALVFDEGSGRFLTKIGNQTDINDPQNGYMSLMDISHIPGTNTVRIISSGQNAFIDYSLSTGEYLRHYPSGQFGDDIAVFEDGKSVVYNEFNSSEYTGTNHLIFYDEKGNLTGRMHSYERGKDHAGFLFTGFLSKIGNDVWFNPPFSDTIYKVEYQSVTPKFVFGFGGKTLPEGMKNKSAGINLLDYSFLNEDFFTDGSFSIAATTEKEKIHIYAFDHSNSNLSIDLRATNPSDPLYHLFQSGRIFPKDSKTFGFAILPTRLNYLISKNKITKEALDNVLPGLYDKAAALDRSGNPIIIYLSFNHGVKLEQESTSMK
ncbi:MAG: 6-bladed beta-propeller [Saprospiraceae bacterium]